MRYEKISRMAGLLSAALVATVTFAVAAHAVQTITTPNAANIAYNLNPGTTTGAITPVANLPVLVLGDQILSGCVGSSVTTIVNSAGQDNELVWNGIESNGQGFTAGFAPTAGTHIMFIDWSGCDKVQLEVNNATSFRVHNLNSIRQQGNVTLIW
jgi:hypothetical protein